MKKIQILGTGCKKCTTLAETADAAAKALGLEYTLEKVTNLNDIASFGVMFTPALVVDGVVKVSELDVVKQFLPRVFPDHDDRVRALQILKGMLQQEIDVEGIARQVSMQMDIHQRISNKVDAGKFQ